MQLFNQFKLPESLLTTLADIGFVNPTPIQIQTIPHGLDGRDILASAQTGTGKTASYGIPLITHLIDNTEGTALVLLPTRELAMQVLKNLMELRGRSKINVALLIGGESIAKQFVQLKYGPRLIVGTPGRINDHLNRGKLKLDKTSFFVLDEVDRMLDMGFGIQLEEILPYLPKQRQTLMFSATLPKNIKTLAHKYLSNPHTISVGDSHIPAANIKQETIKLAASEKYPRLLKEIEQRTGSMLIFVGTKASADVMAEKLSKSGHISRALHGDLRQEKRTRVVDGFRKQSYRILVATDVAARGLDIPHIEHVLNYDLPQNPEDYIHRIGRTARAGALGTAINFISPNDSIKWRAITKLIDHNIYEDRPEHTHNKRKPQETYGRSNGPRKFGKSRFPARDGARTSEGNSDRRFAPRDGARTSEGNSDRRFAPRDGARTSEGNGERKFAKPRFAARDGNRPSEGNGERKFTKPRDGARTSEGNSANKRPDGNKSRNRKNTNNPRPRRFQD